MADAFRGLTLRIGADARPVNSAIQSIKTSANAAQKQLTAMNKALKFDENNADALMMKLDLMGDKASLAANAMSKLKMSIRQNADEQLKFSKANENLDGKLSDVASKQREIYSAVQRTNAEYNTTNAQLERIYDGAARVAGRWSNLKGDSNALAITIARIKQIPQGEALEYLDKLKAKFNAGGEAAKEAEIELRRWADEFDTRDAVDYINQLRNALKGNTDQSKAARAEIDKLVKQASGLKSVYEGFDIQKNHGQELLSIYHALQANHKELKTDLDNLKRIEGFRALVTQVVAFRSELNELSLESTRAKMKLAELGEGGSLAPALNDLKSMSAYSERAYENARRISAAYTMMPNSLAMVDAKIISMAQAEETARAELERIHNALERIRNEKAFDEQRMMSKSAYVEAQKVEQEYTRLTSELKESEEWAKELKIQLDQVRNSGVDEATDEVAALRAALKSAEERADELRASIAAMDESGEVEVAGLTLKFRELVAQEAEAVTAMARLKAETSLAGQVFGNIRTMGYGLYSTVTPAIMMAARYATQAADDVDAAYRNMRKTVQGTEEQFEHLRDAALAFSRTHYTSADQILEIEAIGGQLGIQVENLEKFAEVISNLDIATNLDTEEISANLGQLANIMRDMDQDIQSGPGSFEAFSDALVRLGNNSATQEDRIMAVMMRIGSMGTIMGMTTDQLLALSTAVAASGQGSEAAGTAISRTFSNIESAVSKGGDKLQLFADISGMTASEFVRSWNTSPMETFAAFISGLERLDSEGKSVDGTLRDLGINSVRQKQTLMNLTTQVDVLNDALIMSHDAWYGINDEWGDAGDAAREASRKVEGFSGQLQMLKNTAQTLGVEMLDGFVPLLKVATNVLQGIADIASKVGPEFKIVAASTTVLIAALGPLFIAVGAIGNGITKLRQAFDTVLGSRKYAQRMKELASEGVTVAEVMARNDAEIKALKASEVELTAAQKAHIASLEAENAAMQKATASAKVLRATLKGLASAVAIGAAIEAVFMLVTAIGKAVERSNELKKATDGLESAMSKYSDAANAADDLSRSTSTLAESYKELRESVKSTVDSAIEDNIALAESIGKAESSAEANVATIKMYADKLMELNGTCDGNAELLALQERYLERFNEATGLSVSVVNGLTGALSMNNDELGKNIDLLREQAYANAIREVAENSARSVAELKVQREELVRQLDEIDEVSRLSADGMSEFAKASKEAAVLQYSPGSVVDRKQIEKSIAELDELIEAAEKTSEISLEEYEKAIIDASEATEDFGDKSELANAALEELGDEFEDADEEVDKFITTFSNLKEEFPEFGRIIDDAKIDADGFQTMLDGLGLTMDDVRSSMTQLVDTVTDGFNKIDYESGTSLEKYLENLRNNKEITERWGDNLKELYGRSSDEAYQAWIQNLAEMGPSQALIIDQLTEESTKDLEKWAHEWAETGDAATEAYLASIGYFSEESQNIMHGIVTMLQTLDGMNIKYTVSDDGTVKIAEDEIGYLDRLELARKGFVVTDDGTIEECLDELYEIEGKDGTVIAYLLSDDGTIKDLNGKTSELLTQLQKVTGNKFINVVADTSGASTKLSGIASQVDALMRNSYIEITASVSSIFKSSKNAKGGILSAYETGALLPRNASGALNGIAIKPVLTNIGWVGEDGAEAILNMKNAGGAVVPLTNKRYVTPFAHAVASEMAPAYTNGFPGNVYNVYVNDARINDSVAMRDVTKDFLVELMRTANI